MSVIAIEGFLAGAPVSEGEYVVLTEIDEPEDVGVWTNWPEINVNPTWVKERAFQPSHRDRSWLRGWTHHNDNHEQSGNISNHW